MSDIERGVTSKQLLREMLPCGARDYCCQRDLSLLSPICANFSLPAASQYGGVYYLHVLIIEEPREGEDAEALIPMSLFLGQRQGEGGQAAQSIYFAIREGEMTLAILWRRPVLEERRAATHALM